MKKKNIILTSILFVLFGVYTYIVKTINVKAIGPNKSKVGLATFNGWFSKVIGSNMKIYKVTEYLGYVLLLIVVVFAVIGIIQLIKRKSLLKVDREIVALGILYVLMLAVYALFEKVIINYRPILIDKVLEASYPSSHTVLAMCVATSFVMVADKYFGKASKFLKVIVLILLTLVIAGRIISGVHWATDILGGVLISTALISVFNMIIDVNKDKKKKVK
ncbi:MAG: phosphatase PAP2 family protein [Bacilli bacterium]|nr:phosphatase PAP2 family protein [Bacilli bacterium]